MAKKKIAHTIPTIALEDKVSDYCRWEGDGVEDMMASWREDLERVGAKIYSESVNKYGGELSWTMTLAQCFQIGWEFDNEGAPEAYLARHLDGFDNLDDVAPGYDEAKAKAVSEQILALWEAFAPKSDVTQIKLEIVLTLAQPTTEHEIRYLRHGLTDPLKDLLTQYPATILPPEIGAITEIQVYRA